MHNQRTNRRSGQAFSTKHNDRNFPLENAVHISPERALQNMYWNCEDNRIYTAAEKDACSTFDRAEELFYKRHFGVFLMRRNEERKKHRNPVQSMEQYRKSRNSCPEETLFYIGRKDNTASPEDLQHVLLDFIKWHTETYPQAKFLDWALHCDEKGAPHVHFRKVWVSVDENGVESVGQGKALAQMGVQVTGQTFIDKKTGKERGSVRYRNRKTTYTADCREKFQEIAQKYGYDIIKKPRERNEQGRSLAEYQAQQEEKKAIAAQKASQEAQSKLQNVQKRLASVQSQLAADVQFLPAIVQERTINRIKSNPGLPSLLLERAYWRGELPPSPDIFAQAIYVSAKKNKISRDAHGDDFWSAFWRHSFGVDRSERRSESAIRLEILYKSVMEIMVDEAPKLPADEYLKLFADYAEDFQWYADKVYKEINPSLAQKDTARFMAHTFEPPAPPAPHAVPVLPRQQPVQPPSLNRPRFSP